MEEIQNDGKIENSSVFRQRLSDIEVDLIKIITKVQDLKEQIVETGEDKMA